MARAADSPMMDSSGRPYDDAIEREDRQSQRTARGAGWWGATGACRREKPFDVVLGCVGHPVSVTAHRGTMTHDVT